MSTTYTIELVDVAELNAKVAELRAEGHFTSVAKANGLFVVTVTEGKGKPKSAPAQRRAKVSPIEDYIRRRNFPRASGTVQFSSKQEAEAALVHHLKQLGGDAWLVGFTLHFAL